jgi:Rrf2 family protein
VLKIPKEVDYGILILLALMEEEGNSLKSASEVAEETDLPPHQVAKLLKKLQKKGVVESFRGPKGGYRLNVDPEDLSVKDVYNHFFGSITLTECTTRTDKTGTCRMKSSCKLVPHMVMINEALSAVFSKISLLEINHKTKISKMGV